MEVETIGDTQGKVETKALVDTLAYILVKARGTSRNGDSHARKSKG